MEFIVNSAKEMINLGYDISKKIGTKFLLYGKLWVWKTHFVKGVAKFLGIPEEKIQSPTYSYVNLYDGKLLHIDMYRLTNKTELIDKWILDLIDSYSNICIEWPKREEMYVDNSFIKILIEDLGNSQRKVKIIF